VPANGLEAGVIPALGPVVNVLPSQATQFTPARAYAATEPAVAADGAWQRTAGGKYGPREVPKCHHW
jgi:hypothetical protein